MKGQIIQRLCAALLLFGFSFAAHAVAMNYVLKDYSSNKIYPTGTVLTYNGNTYYALTGNRNKNPETATEYWRLIGNNSNTITTTVAPSTQDGKIGDYYLNIDAKMIYGPKTTQGWGVGFYCLDLRETKVIRVYKV